MGDDNFNPIARRNAADVAVKSSDSNSALHGCCVSSCTEVGPKYGVFLGT